MVENLQTTLKKIRIMDSNHYNFKLRKRLIKRKEGERGGTIEGERKRGGGRGRKEGEKIRSKCAKQKS